MVKTHGGSSDIGKRGSNTQSTQSPQSIGANEKGKPIPLQSIPPQQQTEVLVKKPDILFLPSKDDVVPEEEKSRYGDNDLVQYSGNDEGRGMHVPSTGDYSRKNLILTLFRL
ncbi:hypothetical protein LIER_41182 [Lithospermum erythrorhizon]|uniref:Uncharacterized protein n=1 Tax=Lithospermum erythrorhizon TaxID=34254 RepID=A0AAV3R9J6_LITER